MGIKSIQRLAVKANKKRNEEKQAHKKIKEELQKITGLKELEIGYLPGDGIGVCLEKEGNCDSALLIDVLCFIRENGTITEQELLGITAY